MEVEPDSLERSFSLELARATEAAAVAAARLSGRGDERAADQAAASAMQVELNRLCVIGTIVIGEGARGADSVLSIGERVGQGRGPELDVAVDALEGTTVCAKNLPNSMSLIAVSTPGGLLKTPSVYMDKLAIGAGYPDDIVSLSRTPTENLKALAKAKGVAISDITTCILDRPRHARLIEEVRASGAAIRLIGDGDVAGVIHAANPEETGIDIYMGIGGSQEGVLAAAALRCLGGFMQGRLQLNTQDKLARAKAFGVTDPDKLYSLSDLAGGDVVFAATGVTPGDLLDGVRFARGRVTTHTLVMRSATRTIRDMRTQHFV